MTDAEKDQAITDLIELVGAVDGLLQVQTGLDVDNLEKCLGRTFSEQDRTEITDKVLAAKRYTFIESGATHPKFQETFTQVTTPEQQETVGGRPGALTGRLSRSRGRGDQVAQLWGGVASDYVARGRNRLRSLESQTARPGIRKLRVSAGEREDSGSFHGHA